MKIKLIDSIFIFSVFLLFFSFILQNSFKSLDPDLGWHLRTGKEIVDERQVPVIEKHYYTIKGAHWSDHEWLVNLGSYLIFQQVGYIVLSIIFALTALFLLLFMFFYHFEGFAFNPLIFLVVSWLGLEAILPNTGVRMQELTLVGMLLLLFVLDSYGKYQKIKILWFIPLIFYFWACVHAGFLFGLIVLIAWPLAKAAELALKRYQDKLDFFDFSQAMPAKKIAQFVPFALAGIAATLVTPYGLSLYDFLSSFGNTFYLRHILEWLPVYAWPISWWQVLFMAVVLVAIVAQFAFLIFKNQFKGPQEKINIWWTGLLLVMLVMSFKSKRHAPLLVIAGIPYVVNFFTRQSNVSLDWGKNKMLQFAKVLSAIAFLLLTAWVLSKTNFTNQPFSSYCTRYPCGAAEFIAKNPSVVKSNFFSDFGFGGYLSWVVPEVDLFVDGRLPQYSYQGRSLLEAYFDFNDAAKAPDKLKEHSIQTVLLRKKPIVARLSWFDRWFLGLSDKDIQINNNLFTFLSGSPEWKSCYQDEVSIIFCK